MRVAVPMTPPAGKTIIKNKTMMKKILSLIALLAFGALTFTGCVRKEHDTPPDMSQHDPGLTVTHSIQELLAMNPEYNPASKDDTMLITQDWVISGIVTANDQSGNFYKCIVIQDSTAGLQILIDGYSLYAQYPVGRKVYIKLKGLYLGFDGGTPVLGASINEQRGISNIMGNRITEHLIKANIGNPVPVDTVDLSTIETYQAQYVNRFIVIREAEFKVYNGLTYADPLGTTNRSVENCSGDTIVVRNSNYADFATLSLPSGKGTIAGIYTVFQSAFSNKKTPQLLIRDTSDVKFNKVRCGGVEGTIVFQQDFSSVNTSGSLVLAGWQNIAQSGPKYWYGSAYQSSKYVRVTAFNSGADEVIAWLITPAIDLSGVSNPFLNFKSDDGYDNGAKLEVLVSTDYNGGATPWTATWTVLPANISSGHTSGYGPFVSSGNVSLNGYAGAQTYIAFRYTGADPASGTKKTTTFDIDDVVVAGD